MEKYLQVEWGKNMVFRDSLQFLTASQEQLMASLAKTGRENFYNLHEVVPKIYPDVTLNCWSGRASSATTTSTLSRASMNLLYLHERPSSTSSEA